MAMMVRGAPYGRNASAAVFGDRWYYGSGDSWEIEVYSADGALTHLFRRDEPNRSVTQEWIDEYTPTALTTTDVQRVTLLRRGASSGSGLVSTRPGVIFPETLPAYRSFMASDDGSLWVENYTLPGEQPSWVVFRDDGRYLGEVETPIGAEVTHIGDDFVLVIWENDLGIEQVRMYELIKP